MARGERARNEADQPAAAGKYLYGIIRCRDLRRFRAQPIGDGGNGVATIHAGDLAAVVSDSHVTEYESSRRNMIAHTRVLEEVMQEFTLLPVRFGTVASDADAIREQVLRRRTAEIEALLDEMDGRVELGVKAFWRPGVIFSEIVGENPLIRRIRDSLAGRSAEATYYDQLRLGELVEQAMWRKRDEDAERLLAPLRSLAVRSRGHKVVTDQMVISVAFLVERARQEAFDAAVQALDEQMRERIMFKYVGPVPPYNFVNLVVQWDQPPHDHDPR